MRLLLVDDDHDQLTVRVLLAKQFGFSVSCATTVQHALALAQDEAPDCALVDLRLPDEGSGLQLIRALKNERPSIRIFVLTGSKLDRFESTPERALVEKVHGKGSVSIGALLHQMLEGQSQTSDRDSTGV